jgi:hypothetical protein
VTCLGRGCLNLACGGSECSHRRGCNLPYAAHRYSPYSQKVIASNHYSPFHLAIGYHMISVPGWQMWSTGPTAFLACIDPPAGAGIPNGKGGTPEITAFTHCLCRGRSRTRWIYVYSPYSQKVIASNHYSPFHLAHRRGCNLPYAAHRFENTYVQRQV